MAEDSGKDLARTPATRVPCPEFSAVISCYYEEQSIDEFYTRLSSALASTGRSYEILFVNDGSTDKTFNKLKKIYAADPHVYSVIDLFKNYGQGPAITAGLDHARGRNIIMMDSDLQLDPEELPLLLREFDKGADIVTGFRRERHDSLFRILPSKLANVIMRKISKTKVRDFGCTFKIYNGRLLRAFEFGPCRTFQLIDVFANAQRIAEVPITHHRRRYGKSGWTFSKLFRANLDHMVRLSEKPFQYLAAICLMLAFVILLRIAVGVFHPFSLVQAVTPGLILYGIIISLLIILSILSVIGEFVIRIFLSTRREPKYIVREIFRKPEQVICTDV